MSLYTSLRRPVVGAACALLAVAFTPIAAGATPGIPLNDRSIGTLQQSLDDPAGQPVDFFGDAVALSPTGKLLVVGADGHGENSGHVYVYALGTSGFPQTPTATLPDPSGSAGSDFGRTVAVWGNTIVVGSDFAPAGIGGLAYIYVKGAGGWPTTPTVTLHDPGGATSGDYFGRSVAVSGTAVVVGAPGTNSGAGAAYIYVQNGGIWPSTPTVISPNPVPSVSNSYGTSVGISGANVVVGSSGAVSIEHIAPGGNPTNITRILFDPAGTASGQADGFGSTVAISSKTVVVGTIASVAYIYVKGTTAWPTAPTTTLPDPPGGFSQDNFGISVAASANAIVIGDNASGPNGGGQAFIYTMLGGTWLSAPTASIDDPNGGSSGVGDEFGKSVAVAGTTAAVGAPGMSSDNGTPATGVTYLFTA